MTAMHTIPPGYPMTAAFPDKGVIYSRHRRGPAMSTVWRGAAGQMAPSGASPSVRAFMTGASSGWRRALDLSDTAEGAAGYHDERDPSTPVVARWLG